MKNKAFGLDIGQHTIKAVWLSTEQNGFFLNSAVSIPTPSRGMLSESPLDQEEMAQAIHTMLVDAHITTKYVNIALPESQVYTRVISMPILSDKELLSAIYWEAEQYIPVPLNTITLDYKVLHRPEKSAEGSKMDVLLVGAPTALIDKYEKVLSLSGLVLTSVETEILSTIRAIAIGDTYPPTLILTIGATSTSLAIVQNNLIKFTYATPTGGIALSRAIASSFGFSLEQAEEYKKTYGLSEQNFGGKIAQSVQPVLSLIVSELKKAIAFYQEKEKDTPIAQIVLAGGSAKLPGLATYLTSIVGIETVIANPWKILVSQEIAKNIVEDASSYTIATGLAMR